MTPTPEPSVRPDEDCPRGMVYELDHPQDGPGVYAHPADIEQAKREGWVMAFPRCVQPEDPDA